MNAFQKCRNTSDAVPLYLPQQLYLKPIARFTITVNLPKKLMGKSISNWELMEKLRSMISPEEFSGLKILKSTIEFIRFEGEIEDKSKLEKLISKVDGKTIKLKEFHDLFKVRALETRQEFPNKHVWDSFFRDAKDMDEMKPGERPDTIHISSLPIRWFVPYHLTGEDDLKPSEKIFYWVFEKFGRIRYVDIPICDPYRKQMKSHLSGLQTFSFDEKELFEGYVQFKDYMGFVKTMDALCGMKLLHKDNECDEIYTVNIKVDFDRTKHMTDTSIKRREIVRERLIKKEKLKELKEQEAKDELLKKEQAERQKEINLKNEKENRRRQREEKRKTKILSQLKVKEADDINDKIAKEEKKLLRAQRKLEAIRLVEELFKRIESKREQDFSVLSEIKKESADELTKYKTSSELQLHNQREKLQRAIEGRVVLKTILAGQNKSKKTSSSSDTSLSIEDDVSEKEKDLKLPINHTDYIHPINANWYSYSQMHPYMGAMYNAMRGPVNYYPYMPRGRNTRGLPGTSRGLVHSRRNRGLPMSRYRGRGRLPNSYPPELQEEYYRYFQKFLHNNHDDNDDRDHRSYSRSRSRSKSRSYSGSRRSRSRRRSYTRSYSRSRSRNRRSRSRTRTRSHGRRTHSGTQSRSVSRSRSSRSHKGRTRSKGRSTKSRSKSKDKISTPKSVDSTKFMTPTQLKNRHSRSWSHQKESVGASSWKTPSP